jgi:2-polyprenyl-6-methoxyphenol hydroxylase-like FAD-dependent oxidoreductase
LRFTSCALWAKTAGEKHKRLGEILAKSERDSTAIIVGGGIGGLCTAIALAQKGWSVRVLEQAPQFGAIGYGIQLGPNVFPMFEALGVAQAVRAKSVFPGNVWMFDALDGQPVTRVRTDAGFVKRYGHPYVVIHRVDLHNLLVEECLKYPSIHLDENAAVTSFEDFGDHVVVSTQDGRRVEGAFVVGADGIRSRLRTLMIGDGDPTMIGYVAHRTIVPIDQAPAGVNREDVALWGGPGFHIVHYPLRDNTMFNIVAVFRTDTFSQKGDVESYRAELQATYRDAHPAMRNMIAMLDLERRWPIGDREPRRGWSQGRAVLIGDSAHATLQSLAQGAGMAIEDSVIFAQCVKLAGDDHPRAFRAFEKLRLARTARVQYESRFMWNYFYHTDDVESEARNAAYRARSDEDVWLCLDWLYKGAPVPNEI